MKIRNPTIIKWTACSALSSVSDCTRVSYYSTGPNLNPMTDGFEGRYIYVFWHENILVPCYHPHAVIFSCS